MRKILLITTVLLLIASVVYAKAYYAPKNEMIEKAEIIAVVDITEIKDVKIKGEHWTYGQKATGKVEQLLKGKIPSKITIYGMENFICAQCRYEVGKFLVFLKHDNDLLVGSNWQFSIRPIKNDKVEWYKKDADDRFDLEYLPLSEVLKELKSKIEQDQPLQLTIKSDKQVYEVGEAIEIIATLRNISEKEIQFDSPSIYTNPYLPFRVESDGIRKSWSPSLIWLLDDTVLPYFEPIVLPAKKELIIKGKWKAKWISDPKIKSGNYKIQAIFSYPTLRRENFWTGTITSNTITIEVVVKGKKKEQF